MTIINSENIRLTSAVLTFIKADNEEIIKALHGDINITISQDETTARYIITL